jgi:type II secretion system protein G
MEDGRHVQARDCIGLATIALILFAAVCMIRRPMIHFSRKQEVAKHLAVSLDIQALNTQLKVYKSANFFFPTSEQGLQALVSEPANDPKPPNWRQLLRELPKDPWRDEYIYRCPGTRNPRGYDLFSAGPDGKPDTADDDWGG